MGAKRVDEWHGETGTEAIRTVNELVRSGSYRLALGRAKQALQIGQLGRKQSARLHSLICWLFIECLQQTSPAAVLHGEESVRLARLVHDPWLKCEALAHLVVAYCHMEDTDRARLACEEIAREVELNPKVIQGGLAALSIFQAVVLAAEGDESGCLAALERGESLVDRFSPQVLTRLRVRRVGALLSGGRYKEAAHLAALGLSEADTDVSDSLEWGVYRAWLMLHHQSGDYAQQLVAQVLEKAQAVGNNAAVAQCLALKARLLERKEPKEARQLARQAMHRLFRAGRLDLSRQLSARLGHLLGEL